ALSHDRLTRKSSLARQPLPGSPVVRVEELPTPHSTLLLTSSDLGRVKGTVVCEAPAVDNQSVPQVRVSGIPDPLVVLRLYQETHHWLIADQLAEELSRFLPTL